MHATREMIIVKEVDRSYFDLYDQVSMNVDIKLPRIW